MGSIQPPEQARNGGPTTSLELRHLDFLYWHAVSKMRMADFEGASRIFRLVTRVRPQRHDAALGRTYCLIRLGHVDEAATLVAGLRAVDLARRELRLLGRLHRRCEFERARRVSRERALRTAAQGMALSHPVRDEALSGRLADADLQVPTEHGQRPTS